MGLYTKLWIILTNYAAVFQQFMTALKPVMPPKHLGLGQWLFIIHHYKHL